MFHRIIALALALLTAAVTPPPAAPTAPPLPPDTLLAVTLDVTPAWGDAAELATHRIVLLPQAGEIQEMWIGLADGRVRDHQTWPVPEAAVARLTSDSLPGLLTWPAGDGPLVCDGWYTTLTLDFAGDYTLRFGGHVADETGPAGFRAACEALRTLLAQAKAGA